MTAVLVVISDLPADRDGHRDYIGSFLLSLITKAPVISRGSKLGEYHIVDISRNTVVDTHVDLLDKATEVKRERIEAETVNLN